MQYLTHYWGQGGRWYNLSPASTTTNQVQGGQDLHSSTVSRTCSAKTVLALRGHLATGRKHFQKKIREHALQSWGLTFRDLVSSSKIILGRTRKYFKGAGRFWPYFQGAGEH